jgi:hypothetical protein
MKRFPFSIFILLSASILQASEIHLHFPHFAGHAFEWNIFQGKDPVTVRSGEIPPDGRVTLTMPEIYQDYRGMTRKISPVMAVWGYRPCCLFCLPTPEKPPCIVSFNELSL